MVNIVATRNPVDTFGFLNLLHHNPFFPYRIRCDMGNNYMLQGRGWQASSYCNYTSLDLLLLFCYCFVRPIFHRWMNEKRTNNINMMENGEPNWIVCCQQNWWKIQRLLGACKHWIEKTLLNSCFLSNEMNGWYHLCWWWHHKECHKILNGTEIK